MFAWGPYSIGPLKRVLGAPEASAASGGCSEPERAGQRRRAMRARANARCQRDTPQPDESLEAHQISTVQRNLDSGFFISENTQYPAIGPVRACDVINIAGSFLLKIELSKSKGEVYPFSGSASAHVGRGAFFVFSPSPHLSP